MSRVIDPGQALIQLISITPLSSVPAGPLNSLAAASPTLPSLGAALPTSAPTAGQSFSLDTSGNIPVGVTAQSVTMLSADPASPVNGQYWYRTDLNQWCVRNAATTKRSAAFT